MQQEVAEECMQSREHAVHDNRDLQLVLAANGVVSWSLAIGHPT